MSHTGIGRARACATLIAASIAALSAQADAAPADGALPPRPLIAAPTPKDFGAPAKLPDMKLLKPYSGTLDCDAAGETCVVRAMPLLHQSDPALDAPIDSFLAPILGVNPIPVPDEKGEPTTDASGAVVNYTTAGLRNAIKGVACYDTSIVTVIHTALANRGKDAPPLVNRTLRFDKAQRWSEFSTSKTLRQQVLQNYWAFLGQQKFADPDAAPPGVPQPMFFHEVAADLGGGVKEACDPYVYRSCTSATGNNGWTSAFIVEASKGASITNEDIIARMKAGYVTMISYVRYDPHAEIKGRGLATAFRFAGYHKVVFAGFQPGPWPLLVYDVGNGQAYQARLSSKVTEMTFDAKPAGVFKIAPADKEPGYMAFADALDRPFLIYKDEDLSTNPQIKFVENYEGLRIAPPAQQFREPVLKPAPRQLPAPVTAPPVAAPAVR